MSRYVLALDQGTTSSRALLFDHGGAVVAVDQHEFPQYFPEPGWVEHDPMEIWESQLRAARGVLERAGVSAADLAAVGITNQRETAVVWERETGRPIYPAIVWQSRQSMGICDQLRERGLEEEVKSRTGLVVDAYFSGTKVRFILDAVEGAQKRAEAGELCFGTVDSWLLYKLTGGRVHATEYSNASRTLLYNIHECAWDDFMLSALDIPRAMLPEVRDSSGEFGRVESEWLGSEVPITGVAGDQQAALFGQGCFESGRLKNTYGTGCFLLMNTGREAAASETGLLTTLAWGIGGEVEYALEGSVFVAGAAVQWLRDGLGFFKNATEIEKLAASVKDNGDVYLVPAFAGLGAPHWDQHARGVLCGLTRGATKAHIARAALEGIAYQVRDVLAAMEADAGLRLKELRVDGGASANNLLMQFQSDLLNVPVVRPRVTETTALGAAYLAGLAVGYWQSKTDIAQQWQQDRRFAPQMKPATRHTLVAGWDKALNRAKDWED